MSIRKKVVVYIHYNSSSSSSKPPCTFKYMGDIIFSGDRMDKCIRCNERKKDMLMIRVGFNKIDGWKYKLFALCNDCWESVKDDEQYFTELDSKRY